MASGYDAWIDAASAAVGLTVPEASRPGVARSLALASEMAATLEAVNLGDDLALAPVFLPPEIARDG